MGIVRDTFCLCTLFRNSKGLVAEHLFVSCASCGKDDEMENRKVTSNCSIPVITEQTTLGGLISALGPVIKAEMTPNSKTLRETAGAPIASEDRCVVYSNGYAVYDNGTGRTVVWVPDCTSFTYSFNRMKKGECDREKKESSDLPEKLLESQPWPIGITLIGEHRIERLIMHRKGDRKHNKSLIRGDNEEGGTMEGLEKLEDALVKEYFWREDQIGEDPETVYLRKEVRQEILKRMTEKQREVFILYYRYGYIQQEIADMIGISQQNISKRLKNAEISAKTTFSAFFF